MSLFVRLRLNWSYHLRHVIDNFLTPELLASLSANWLPENSGHWHLYENRKKATKDPRSLPVCANVILAKMAQLPISDLLGISGAFPDLEYLHGAGLHQIPNGGRLGLHLDSERHPLLPWRREASAVLYVDDVDGGELELCDSSGVPLEKIETRSNRLVLFATQNQWHRVAECRSIRRSLCLFFWSLNDGGTATTATFVE